MNQHTKTIAASYMRYSSVMQDEGYSLEAQEKAIRRYADEHHLDLQYVYYDKAKTGTNDNRPYFRQMIADAKKGLFKVLLVHKIDRFSRSRFDSIVYKNELRKLGVELISVTENFGDGPEAAVMEGISEIFAEFYSKNLGREVKKGLDILASKGLHTGGRPPLGYDVSEEKKLVINEAEAEIVRLIFDRYANNYTYNEIIKELNAKGYTTKMKMPFSGGSLNSILNQRKYIGEYVYARRAPKDMRGRSNSHKNRSEDEITRIPGAVPRIVDDETFNKVQYRLQINKRKTGRYKSKSNYLFSGLIFCGECGYHYQGNTRPSGKGRTNIYSSYRCGNRQNHKAGCTNREIEKNRLETFVLEQMQRYLFSDWAIHRIVEQINEYNKSIQKTEKTDLILYQAQLKEVEKEIGNITQAVSKGMAGDIMIDKVNSLYAAKKDIEARIECLSLAEITPITEEEIRQALSKFQSYMKENNAIECKRFIDHHIDKVIINQETVEVVFKVASTIREDNKQSTDSMLKTHIAITREELKQKPKQRRKIPQSGQTGGDYLVDYEIVPAKKQ